MPTRNSINPSKMAEIKQLPSKNTVLKGDPLIETYRRDAVMGGNPDVVVRPRDWREVGDVLSWCNGRSFPVTVCGARTSMTGSSVAKNGVLITTDHFNKVVDIGVKDGRPYAVVEPAVIVGEFQKAVEEHGLHYPVAPTSCNDAFIGGTVATNATGEDFYKYGPTRAWVREISYIKVDGTAGMLKRKTLRGPRENAPFTKGLGGYYLNGEEIDEIIGSEGTLVVITRVILELMPVIPKTFIIMVPFASNFEALKFIDDINKNNFAPRALEFIGTNSLAIMQTHPTCPKFGDDAKAFVYIKDEALPEVWHERIPEKLERSMVFTTEKQKRDLHDWRHHIPAATSERHEQLEKQGGGKVSGDWWVPKIHMVAVMQKFYKEADASGIEYIAYGHLGDGHPHTSYICKTPDEIGRAKELVLQQSAHAVKLGGGVAAEHGLGKIKRRLVSIQHGPDVIKKMYALKQLFDPNWILGRGNILLPPDEKL